LFTHPAVKVARTSSPVTGGVVVRDLAAATTAVRASATFAAGRAATRVLPGIVKTTTIAGTGGLNVISTPKIELIGSAKLTITGGPSDEFVINVAGGISLGAGTAIVLSGVLPSQVLFNMTVPTKELALTGSKAAGTFLNPGGPVSIRTSTVTGSVLGGRAVQISSSTIKRS
jgi:hypothetical protein